MTRDEYLQRRTEFAARGQALPQAKLLDMDVIDIRSAKRQRDKLQQYIKDHLSNQALCDQPCNAGCRANAEQIHRAI